MAYKYLSNIGVGTFTFKADTLDILNIFLSELNNLNSGSNYESYVKDIFREITKYSGKFVGKTTDSKDQKSPEGHPPIIHTDGLSSTELDFELTPINTHYIIVYEISSKV